MHENLDDPQRVRLDAVEPVSVSDTAMEDLQRLVELAESGVTEALPELRRTLAERSEVLEQVANLGHAAEAAWIQKIAGSNAALAASLREQLECLKENLVGKTPTMWEELLARQASLTYLQTEFYETAVATLPLHALAKQKHRLEQRRDAAHKQHILALKSFAETSRLLADSPQAVGPPGKKPKGRA
jgi:hypothetical protein